MVERAVSSYRHCLIFFNLSFSRDHGFKFSEYRKLDSLEEDAWFRSIMRASKNSAVRRTATGCSTIGLESVACSVPLTEIYASVEF